MSWPDALNINRVIFSLHYICIFMVYWLACWTLTQVTPVQISLTPSIPYLLVKFFKSGITCLTNFQVIFEIPMSRTFRICICMVLSSGKTFFASLDFREVWCVVTSVWDQNGMMIHGKRLGHLCTLPESQSSFFLQVFPKKFAKKCIGIC